MLANCQRYSVINQRLVRSCFVRLLSSEEASASDEDEIEKKRNVSRLPPHLWAKMQSVPPATVEEVIERQRWYVKPRKQKNILRKQFGVHGKASGVELGMLWPTGEELKSIKEFEQMSPTLEEMIEELEKANKEKKEATEAREKEVLEKYSKLKGWIDEFEQRRKKKIADAEADRAKKEKVIEEIRAYLGYRVDVNDEKFKEILEQKEKEQKKAIKEAKKKEKIAKDLAKLNAEAEKAQQEKKLRDEQRATEANVKE